MNILYNLSIIFTSKICFESITNEPTIPKTKPSASFSLLHAHTYTGTRTQAFG